MSTGYLIKFPPQLVLRPDEAQLNYITEQESD